MLLLCGLLPFILNLDAYFLSDDFVLLHWTHAVPIRDVLGFLNPDTDWFYRPIVKLYYWAGQNIFGLRAAPFHAVSIVLHWTTAYLLYLLIARQVRSNRVVALAAALFFLLNPYHAETVSWIAATGDLIAVLCMFVALLLFHHFWMGNTPIYLAGSLALFAVALLTRETAVVLPVLILLYAVTLLPNKHGNLPRLAAVLSAYTVILLMYLLVQVLGRTDGQLLERGGLRFRALHLDSVMLGVMDYIHGLAPAGHLVAQLPLDTLRGLVWLEWAFILLLVALQWRTGQRVMLFGMGWLLITPLLFVFFSPPTDRYFYLPSVGYAIFIAALFNLMLSLATRLSLPILRASSKIAVAVMVCLFLVGQAVQLTDRVLTWRSVGHASGGVIHDVRKSVPNPPDQASFFFVDLPPALGRVPFFQNGLLEAVQLAYGKSTLAASSTTCDELQTSVLPVPSFFFRFKGNGVYPFSSSSDCPRY